jgi:hypothetical protein
VRPQGAGKSWGRSVVGWAATTSQPRPPETPRPRPLSEGWLGLLDIPSPTESNPFREPLISLAKIVPVSCQTRSSRRRIKAV